MEEIDDFAAFICYNMILSSLPVDQRGRGDFGEYLRADENIVRRLLNALSITPPDDFTYDNVVKILDHTGQVSGLSGDDLAPARGNMRRVLAIRRAHRTHFMGKSRDVDDMCAMIGDAVQAVFDQATAATAAAAAAAAAAASAAPPGAGAPPPGAGAPPGTHHTLRETDFHGGLSEVDAQRLLIDPYVSALLKSAEAGDVNALRGHLSNPGGADGPSPDLHAFRTLLYNVSRKRKDTVTHQERLHHAAPVTALSRLEKASARVISTAKAAILELALRRLERGGRDIPIDLLKQKGWTPKSKPRIFSSHPPP